MGRGRSVTARDRVVVAEDVQLDPVKHELHVRGRGVHLRPRESALLEILAGQPGRTFTRQELLEQMGHPADTEHARTIDVHVRWLRAKLQREKAERVRLVTVRGFGYRLESR